jgi:hypothetical protein
VRDGVDIEDSGLVRRSGTAYVARTHLRAVHPDHGEHIVFVPGEAIPRWLVDAIAAESRDDRKRFVAPASVATPTTRMATP